MPRDIREVKNITDLIGYFSTNLGWDIDIDDFDNIEDISYDFDASDIGLREESFAKILSLRQLQPLVDGQQWGIFCVEFDSNKFEPSALKKILSGLIPRKRNSADHAVWCQQDLLFICNWGINNNSTIGLAHFEDREGGLPQIKMFSCAPALEDFTQIKVFEERLNQLSWPKNTSNIEEWRQVWSSAFTLAYKQTIQDSSTLTVQLAAEAQNIRNRILDILNVETKNGYVHLLFEKFKDSLIHDMTEQEFADMYAQTVVYGLFSARCLDTTQEDFSAVEAISLLPNTNPFLKSLLRECFGAESRSKLSFDELEIGNVVDLLRNTKTDAIIQDFNRQTGGGREDPVIHFYEEFLTAYDKAQKIQRGVFYTPQPVVNFIVKAVDSILKKAFGYSDGLASEDTKTIKIQRESQRRVNGLYKMIDDTEIVPAVQILDPATGTGTFLRQVILQIYENFCNKHKCEPKEDVAKAWNAYVDRSLLTRVNGFELMMAPYAVAHMKLAMVLKDTGYDFHGENRLNVFLTNSLEEAGKSDMQMTLWDDPLAVESIEANAIKKNTGLNIILGNPPYAGESSNKGEYILKLMEEFKYEPGTKEKLQEVNSKFINDDYIKFIRYSQHILESNGDGILCFINPHGYIDSPTFRGVRYSLLKEFFSVYVIDIHGNSKKKEKCPDGSKDENVFDIQQGVCINLFIKKGNSKLPGKVYHFDLYGTREYKYDFLNRNTIETIQWEEIPLVAPNYVFNYKKSDIEDEYNEGFSVRELFELGTLGVLSKRDSLAVANKAEQLKERILHFINSSISTENICNEFGIPIKDNDKWNAESARNRLSTINDIDEYIVPLHYRPFDVRYVFYQNDIVARPNRKVLSHLNNYDNIALVVCRQGGASNLDKWDCAFVVDIMSDQNIFRRGGGTVMPLFVYYEEFGIVKKRPNFNEEILEQIAFSLKLGNRNDINPMRLLGYIYAYLYSEKYRQKYKAYMSKDFPKIPYPKTYEYFMEISEFGLCLIELQTKMDVSSRLEEIVFIEGSNMIEKTVFKGDALYINKSQSFAPVNKETFDYTIGGNSPIQKWLKDRKGEMMSNEDVTHMKKMIVTIEKIIGTVELLDQKLE